jgi:hypothetical protein
MNTRSVDAIANALLYEGYMLYPYRPSSVKNRQRFNFGVICPRAWSENQTGSDIWTMQTECLVEGSLFTALELQVRFLQLVNRSVGKVSDSLGAPETGTVPAYELVPVLEANGKIFQPWQEAIERTLSAPACNLEALTAQPLELPFSFAASRSIESVWADEAEEKAIGVVVRDQAPISGSVEVSATSPLPSLFRVTVRIKNLTSTDGHQQVKRDDALMRSLISAHTVLGAVDGKFVSLLDPPANLGELSSCCQNAGTWPVLVGEPGQRDTMLSSPIILYDYPQIAPESPGDLFDGTEIDEILALRIMTMTDEEKREMRSSDERARKILERTERLPIEHLTKLHSTLRDIRPVKETP